MGIDQYKDVEQGGEILVNGLEDLESPLMKEEKVVSFTSNETDSDGQETDGGSIGMVLISIAVALCGSFQFGSCVGYSGPAESSIREDLKLSIAEYSTFGSILNIGAMLGAITSGRIADAMGRKGAMRISALFGIAGWLAIVFSNGTLSLDLGRFLTGYSLGGFSYVVPIFVAEISPKNLRGGLANLHHLMVVMGSCLSFLIGAVIKWRKLALIGVLPCLVTLAGLCFIPESPRWLAKVGREKEFQVALQKLRGKDADVTREAAAIQVYNENLQSLPKVRLVDLFQSQYIRPILIGMALMGFQQFGGINGIGFYASETFKTAGAEKFGTMAFAIVQVPFTILGAVLIDKSGRRPLIMVSAGGTFLGCLLAGTSFYLKGNGLLLVWVPLLLVSGVLVYISGFSFGMGAVPWVIMSEIFPINIKGIGGSLVVLVTWLAGWIVSFTFNFLMDWSSSGTFFLYSGFSLLTIVHAAKFVPETKGKTLEEIQACFDS